MLRVFSFAYYNVLLFTCSHDDSGLCDTWVSYGSCNYAVFSDKKYRLNIQNYHRSNLITLYDYQFDLWL